MDNEYFLVKWIHETPVRCSVMSRIDIYEEKERQRSVAELVKSDTKFRWKKKICSGLILSAGNKYTPFRYETIV